MHLFSTLWIWPLLLAALLALPAVRKGSGSLLVIALLPGWSLWGLAWTATPLDWHQAWSFWLLGAHWRLDALSHAWLGLTLAVWTLAALHSEVMVACNRARYAVFFLLSLSGSLLWVLAGDAVSFYLGFSLMSISAWGLVMHEGTPKALRAGRWYLVLALIGELVLFVGVVARAAETGTLRLADWQALPGTDWVLLCLWLGLAIKAGVPLLHVWLPLAHPAAPVPASAVLSGVMIKAGVIGWWLLLPGQVLVETHWPQAMLWLGLLTMLYGAVFGVMQTDPKTLLAYSSISQMGWLIWGLGWVWQMGAPEVGMLWLSAFALHHALVKSGLFLSVGWLKAQSQMPGWQRTATWLGVGLLALALAGVPLSSGDWVKTALKVQAAGVAHQVSGVGLWLGALATALLMGRFLMVLRTLDTLRPVQDAPDRAGLNPWVWLSWWLGIATAWGWFVWQIQAWGVGYAPSWLSGLTPLFVAVLLLWVWHRLRLRGPAVAPGDVLVWYEWLWHLLARPLHQGHLRWHHWQQSWPRRLQTWYGRVACWFSRWHTRSAKAGRNAQSEWAWLMGAMMALVLILAWLLMSPFALDRLTFWVG
ncbi:complex I subunit 5 family protein [Thiomicrospira sp. WB1]|uniref:complex I subunit 5 family protein n=1 Tax=Thiomicrospira sp. WB1 TaxID=1685380 RepID=UPI00074ADDC0|nr:complex I subunit 5 family protein [Thiomicrospira sp. WB1]KUJ71084.1 hypothetical protein AVO41_09445 [Thiomicrospira sp. WB1]